MSVKPSKKNLLGVAIALMTGALTVALPVRVYQYLRLMREGTGFFDTSGKVYTYGLYIFLALVCILLLCLSSVGSKTHTFTTPVKKSGALSFFSVISALSVLGYSGYSLYTFVTGNSLDSQVMGDATVSVYQYLTLVQGVLGVLCSAFFVVLAVNFARNTPVPRGLLKTFAVFPVLWFVSRLLVDFLNTVAFLKVSELFLEMFMLVFSMVFYVNLAKFLLGYQLPRAQFKVFGFGLVSALFSFVCAVPRYILLAFSAKEYLYSQSSLVGVCDLVLGVFTVALLLHVFGNSKRGEEHSQL